MLRLVVCTSANYHLHILSRFSYQLPFFSCRDLTWLSITVHKISSTNSLKPWVSQGFAEYRKDTNSDPPPPCWWALEWLQATPARRPGPPAIAVAAIGFTSLWNCPLELFQLKTKNSLRTSGCNHGTYWLISSTQMRKLTNWKFDPVASTGKIPNIQKRLQLHSSKQNDTKPNHVTPLWSNEQSWSFQLNVRVGACSPSSAPESGCFEKNPSLFFGVIFA